MNAFCYSFEIEMLAHLGGTERATIAVEYFRFCVFAFGNGALSGFDVVM